MSGHSVFGAETRVSPFSGDKYTIRVDPDLRVGPDRGPDREPGQCLKGIIEERGPGRGPVRMVVVWTHFSHFCLLWFSGKSPLTAKI